MTDPFAQTARMRIGQVLREKWRLDSLIGVGGMAAVFAATHRNGKRVAIKILHPQIAVDQTVEARFLREGYVANSIGHDGAVSVLDDDETDDGSVFLVMELLEGETLDARAARFGGRLPTAEVVALSEQLLDVLVAAHAKGIVHRDIKPENLFLTKKGQLKVLDFGIARLLELAGSTAATKTGSMLGTPAFMPPEQALGYVKDVDQRSDLWAVGATMFTLLSGEAVHHARTVNEQLVSAATKAARSVGEVAPNLSASLVGVIDRALAFEQAERWSTALDMLDALRASSSLTGSEDEARPAIRNAVPSHVVAKTVPIIAAPSGTTANSMALGRTVNDPPKRPQRRVSKSLALFAVGIVASLVAGVFVFNAYRSHDPAEGTAGLEADAVLPPPSAARSGEPSKNKASTSVQGATVRIIAKGGACRVSVDDTDRGMTPLAPFEVTPGRHEVRCESHGLVQTETLDARSGDEHQLSFFAGGATKGSPPSKTPLHEAPPPPTTTTRKPPAPTANPLDIR